MLRCAVALRGRIWCGTGFCLGTRTLEVEPVVLRGPEVKGGTGCF